MPGRDVFVQAWYQGGLSILDFTDPANAYEIAYFDRGPIDPDVMVLGGYWSTYWYDGRIYGTEIVRGLDVFELMPSDYLSENEIAAARLADQGQTFNPQQQYPVSWPEHPVVGLAYLDQLMRDEALPAEQAEALYAALGQAADAVDAGEDNAALSRELRQLRRDLSGVSVQGEASVRRLSALQDVIEGVSASLR